jgi:hypothetical protein
MDIVKVLKRKDAASVIVAVVVAMVLVPLLSSLVGELSRIVSGLNEGQVFGYAQTTPGTGWQGEYLFPVVFAALQLIALEVLIRLYVLVHDAVSGK